MDPGFAAAVRGESDGQDLERTWSALSAAAPAPVSPEETDRAWAELSARVGLSGQTATAGRSEASTADIRPESARRVALRVLSRAAAVVLLAAGASAAWYAVPVTRTADAGERMAVVLPDGSEVELNAGSSLRYRRGFSLLPGVRAGSRSVTLSGEAFFDVTSGIRAFRVEAGGAEVRVLGTQFNVRARDESGSGDVRVEVEEGRVEVWSREADESVILAAGEGTRVSGDDGTLDRLPVAPERIAAWRAGGLTAVDEPLAVILQELSLRFGVRIDLLEAEAGTRRLDVYYPSVESLESVLADLATQQDLRYRRINNGWELF